MSKNEVPDPPAWLTPEARTHWDRVAPQAHANRTLSDSYVFAFALMCGSLADMVCLQGVIRQEGLTIGGTDGRATKAHPALRQLESCRAHVVRQLEGFGLNPKSRKQVKEEAPPTADNPWMHLDD